ncbi:MAG TPA: transglutaminase domain-containing protein [Polyangiaceae bacterium]|nr:transglutaminase domain-containing protein [Polyangiaceae bacterium]
MKKGPRSGPAVSPGAALAALSKLVFWALVVCLPLLGAWVASSLAAYANRPPWAAALAGLLLFPIAPLLWEGYAALRRRGSKARRHLTFGDRVVLRTLALSLTFLALVLGALPRDVFTALTVRGDWALEGRSGARVDEARRRLFALASRLEWLYLYAKGKNPYGDGDRGPESGAASRAATSASPPPASTSAAPLASARPAPASSSAAPPASPRPAPASSSAAPPVSAGPDSASGSAAPIASAGSSSAAPIASAGSGSAAPIASAGSGGEPAAVAVAWPLPSTLHPLVTSLPPEHETSPASVARYLAERERDPVMLVKALHDYVADRIAYDAPAFLARTIPRQGVAKVFAERKGVCEGYARLFAELGRVAGLEVAYVVGDARGVGGDLSGLGHAWNAVRLGGTWRLVDVTWDAGALQGGAFEKRYQSDYLMPPPEVFGRTHLPDEPSWQLRPDPLSRGEFLRQPLLRPAFFALGLSLTEPDRSQVTVERSFGARLKNPEGVSLLASAYDKGSEAEAPCEVGRGPEPSVRCDLPAAGTYHVRLFGARERFGRHAFVAQIEVNRGP